MKKTLFPVILLALTVCLAGCNEAITSTPPISEGSNYDVFYIDWGMSEEDIVSIEGREPDESGPQEYVYENKEFNGLTCSLTYGFEKDMLSYFECCFDESCSTVDNYNAIKDCIEEYIPDLTVDTSVELDGVRMISWVNGQSKIDLSWTKNLSWTEEKGYTNSLVLSASALEP